MPAIYIDADACSVKDEVYRVAERYAMRVVVVANALMRVPKSERIEMVLKTGFGEVDDWIAEQVTAEHIVITADIPLAARCLEKGARVLGPKGYPLTESDIGGALAMRAVGALTDDATTVVTAIQVDADRLSVAGVTVDAQAPSVLAERLDGQLVTVGWRMQDLQVHRSADSAVEAWDFSLIAGDPASAGARGATKPAAIKPAANRRATSP